MPAQRFVSKETKVLGPQAIRTKGTLVFQSTRPTKIQPAADDVIIIADEGDRLDNLAAKFYNSPRLWFAIASVNNLTNGSLHIKPGTQLRIPSRQRIVG